MHISMFRAFGLSTVLLFAACGSTTSTGSGGGGTTTGNDTAGAGSDTGGGGCAKNDPKNVSCKDTTPCTVTCDCGGGSTMDAGGCNAGFCASAEDACNGACGATWGGGFCSHGASTDADTTSGGDGTGENPGCSDVDPAGKLCMDTAACEVSCECDDGSQTTFGSCHAGVCASALETCTVACGGTWGGKFCGK